MDSGIGVGGLNLTKDEVVSSPFNVFAPIEIETSVTKRITQTFHPASASTSMGPFHITAPADVEKWTDPQSIRLHGRMRLSKLTGNVKSNLDNNDEMGVVDNIFHSLWGAIRVKLNGTEITDPTAKWYAYKSLIETKLSYSHDTKQLLLSNQGYSQDTANHFEDYGTPASGGDAAIPSQNVGWLTRKEWFANSKWVYFNITLHHDIATLRNYIPPYQKIEVICERNSDSFSTSGRPVAGKTYPIDLENVHLTLDRVEPSAEVQKHYLDQIKAGLNPRLTIDRSVIKSYIVTGNKSDLSHYNIISGSQLPDQIIIGIVSEEAYNGSLTTNPFKFDDYNIIEASLLVNGRHEPVEMYKMNKSENDTADMWSNFLTNVGIGPGDDTQIGLTKEDYFGGTFLLAWDRTPDKCNR